MTDGTDHAGSGHPRTRARWPWVVGGAVAFVVVASFADVLVGRWVIRTIFDSREVGPDAEQMAEDPLLHLELEGADADSIRAMTGREGGVMPAWENPDSEASRRWHLQGDDWERLLVDVIDMADGLDVSFWRLRCLPSSITYSGVKPVTLGDDIEIMHISIRMGHTDSPPRLRITLRSSENDLDPDQPPGWIDDPVDDDCPASLAEQFDRVGSLA